MTDSVARRLVLVVEDDPAIARLLELDLQIEEYDVLIAPDGLTGLDLARAQKPDIILLDGMLPGMDGMGVMRELKARPETASIPIVFVSARNHPEIIEEALSGGALRYYPKPFEPFEVIEELGRILDGEVG